MPPTELTERDHALLRAYVLGTLPPAQHERVARRVAEDAAWREACQVEEQRLAQLDALPPAEPPQGLATRTIARATESRRKSRTASVLAGAFATVAVAAAATLLYVAVDATRESALRASSAGNLKQLAIIYKMYSAENRGEWPPVAPEPGVWAPDLQVLHPKYLIDPMPLVDPRHPDANEQVARLEEALEGPNPDYALASRIAAQSYVYTGHATQNAEELARLARRLPEPDDKPLQPLKDGVERFYITDINNPAAGASTQSTIPVSFELVAGEEGETPEGANVLYMDGHVALVPYGTFPVLPEIIEAFAPPPVAPAEE